MKRARTKKAHDKYEDIDVPEMIKHKKNTQQTMPTKQAKQKKKAKKKKNKGFKVFLWIILALLVVVLILMGIGWGNGGNDGALVPVDMEKGKLNVLVLGVDEGGTRTDAMMLVSYDLNNRAAKVLSIPRDTMIKVTDRNKTRKINEIHSMHDSNKKMLGPQGSIKAVTALTSVPIHYYIEFSFDAIDELTDVLGPIEYKVPDVEGNGRGMNYDDPVQDLHIHLKPGLQMLEGNQVQQFLRYRKSNYGVGDGSDTSRIARQQDFIKAIIDQKVNLSLIGKLPSIYDTMKRNIMTNFTAGDIVKYGKYLDGLTSEKIEFFSLPGESKRLSGGSYYVCDLEKTRELMQTSFDYEAKDITNEIAIEGTKTTGEVLKSENKGKTNKETKQPANYEEPVHEPEEDEEVINSEEDEEQEEKVTEQDSAVEEKVDETNNPEPEDEAQNKEEAEPIEIKPIEAVVPPEEFVRPGAN